MDFNFLSQLKGPDNIPVSMFGDATNAGIAAGTNLPTKTTARIQGAIKGFQQGQEIAQNQQQITLNQNKIEQLPTENEIRKVALGNEVLQNDILKVKAKETVDTQHLHLEDTKAELIENTAKNDAATQNREKEKQFLEVFKSSPPDRQAQIVLSGQADDIFANNPKLQQQLLQSVYVNPNNGLAPADRNRLGITLKKANVQDAYEKQKISNFPKYQEAESALYNDPLTGEAIAKTGYSPNQIYGNTKMVNRGMYETAPDGKTILTKNGQPKLNPNHIRSSTAETSWDMVWKNPDTGNLEIITQNIDKDTKKKFDIWTAQKAIQDGSSLNSDLRAVDRNAAQQSGGQKTQNLPANAATSGFVDPNSSSEPLRVSLAKATLGIADKIVPSIDPLLKGLEESIVKGASDPKLRASSANILYQNDIKEKLGRTIAYDQYDSNPTIQAQNTQVDVDKYNKNLYAEATSRLSGGFADAKTGIASIKDPETIKRLVAPGLASDPKDLYYRKQASVLNKNIQFLSNKYAQIANKGVKASVNKQSSTQRMLADLSSVSGGGGGQ